MKILNGLFLVAISVMAISCNSGGASKATSLDSDIDKLAYSIGVSVGQNLKKDNLKDINTNLISQAISEVINEETTLVTFEESQKIIQEHFRKRQQEQDADRQAQGGENLQKGQAFLEANKAKEGVVTLPSGLQYQIMKEGTGPKPTATDRVKTHYHGTLIDGTVFDSSVDRGTPATFGVSQVIKGWTEALQLMPEGSKWKLFIPAELAYGARGSGPKIGPNSALVFEVELLEIEKAQ